MIKSTSYDQLEILESISELYCNKGFELDATYGNGKFYTESNRPSLCFDIDPQKPESVKGCSTNLPIEDSSISSFVFDPPFLTYVKAGRKHAKNKMVMSSRFGGYWRYDELEDHYRKTLKEASRVLKHKGIMIFKCQDIIHNHKMHCTHINVVNWAKEHDLELKDLFILNAKNRIPSPQKGKQRHARIFHSYFLILEKKKSQNTGS